MLSLRFVSCLQSLDSISQPEHGDLQPPCVCCCVFVVFSALRCAEEVSSSVSSRVRRRISATGTISPAASSHVIAILAPSGLLDHGDRYAAACSVEFKNSCENVPVIDEVTLLEVQNNLNYIEFMMFVPPLILTNSFLIEDISYSVLNAVHLNTQ